MLRSARDRRNHTFEGDVSRKHDPPAKPPRSCPQVAYWATGRESGIIWDTSTPALDAGQGLSSTTTVVDPRGPASNKRGAYLPDFSVPGTDG